MYVGLDFGLRRVGVAISESHIIASPYTILTIKNDPIEETIKEMHHLNSQSTINKLFIGLPIHVDGNESEMSLMVRKLAKRLENLFNAKIVFIDERYSSKNINASIGKGRRYIDDLVAARILELGMQKESK